MKRAKSGIIFLLCAVLLLCAGCGAAEEKENGAQSAGSADRAGDNKEESKQADEGQGDIPDFEMTLCDGTTVSFADYRGKKILLNFWATWCGPCVGEMPAFQRLTEEYPEELVILAVNCSEDGDTVREFVESNGYTFPVVLDTDGAIQYMFGGISSIPVTFIIDEEGNIVSSSTGAADADTMYETYMEALGF